MSSETLNIALLRLSKFDNILPKIASVCKYYRVNYEISGTKTSFYEKSSEESCPRLSGSSVIVNYGLDKDRDQPVYEVVPNRFIGIDLVKNYIPFSLGPFFVFVAIGGNDSYTDSGSFSPQAQILVLTRALDIEDLCEPYCLSIDITCPPNFQSSFGFSLNNHIAEQFIPLTVALGKSFKKNISKKKAVSVLNTTIHNAVASNVRRMISANRNLGNDGYSWSRIFSLLELKTFLSSRFLKLGDLFSRSHPPSLFDFFEQVIGSSHFRNSDWKSYISSPQILKMLLEGNWHPFDFLGLVYRFLGVIFDEIEQTILDLKILCGDEYDNVLESILYCDDPLEESDMVEYLPIRVSSPSLEHFKNNFLKEGEFGFGNFDTTIESSRNRGCVIHINNTTSPSEIDSVFELYSEYCVKFTEAKTGAKPLPPQDIGLKDFIRKNLENTTATAPQDEQSDRSSSPDLNLNNYQKTFLLSCKTISRKLSSS